MMFIKRSKFFITAIFFSWLLQGCVSNSGPESSTIKKSEGDDRLYREAPVPTGVFSHEKGLTTDLDGGISGTGNDKNIDQENAF